MNKSKLQAVVAETKKAEARLDNLENAIRSDSWDESAHKRAADGKFGSGGGSAKASGKNYEVRGYHSASPTVHGVKVRVKRHGKGYTVQHHDGNMWISEQNSGKVIEYDTEDAADKGAHRHALSLSRKSDPGGASAKKTETSSAKLSSSMNEVLATSIKRGGSWNKAWMPKTTAKAIEDGLLVHGKDGSLSITAKGRDAHKAGGGPVKGQEPPKVTHGEGVFKPEDHEKVVAKIKAGGYS